MGLDIYKVKPTLEKTPFGVQNDGLYPNKYVNQLFEDFKQFIVKEEKEYILWADTFAKRSPDLILEEYEHAFISDEDEYVFEKKDNKDETISFKEEELVLEKRQVDVIYFQNLAYQRKCMTREFFDKFVASCWYTENESTLSEYESNDLVLSNEKFKELQSYATEGAAIKDWSFIEGEEIIYLSY